MAGEFTGEPAAVRLALLTAAARLFFKRPPECQRVLGAVLAAATADSNQDVHDRGLLYYRRADLRCSERCILESLPVSTLQRYAGKRLGL